MIFAYIVVLTCVWWVVFYMILPFGNQVTIKPEKGHAGSGILSFARVSLAQPPQWQHHHWQSAIAAAAASAIAAMHSLPPAP